MTRPAVSSSLLRWAFQTLCCFAAAGGLLFAQRSPEVPAYETLVDPTLDKINVADVGPWSISGTEFKLSYEFGPAFVKREKDSKLRCLNFMVYEKLLALDAQRKGFDQWPDVKRQVSEIEADLATEELYQEDVLKHVRITDRQVALGVALDRVECSIRWIYAARAEEMDEQLRKMKSGVPFDLLYETQLKEGRQAADRSMTTTRFKLGLKNPFLAQIVDTLAWGTVSLPVHGPDGWYLLKKDDLNEIAILTESDFGKISTDVRRALRQHIGDSLSDSYIRSLVESRRPVIIRGAFNALVAHLAKIYLDTAHYNEWKLQERKGARELADVGDLRSIASDTLVTMTKGSFSLNDFLEWFRMREPYVALEKGTPVSFFHSAEEMVWRMVRDRLLTQRAFARGFQKKVAVKRQVEWWKGKMLFTANKQSLGDSIVDSLPTLRRYYDEHQRNFADAQGHIKSFEDAKEDVWREYYAQELTRRMLHEVLRLKQKYGVRIDEAALDRIPVDNENDPKSIDVYPVKNGGIYPHAAFPSIDYDWQSWN
jgi:hypothetical protein